MAAFLLRGRVGPISIRKTKRWAGVASVAGRRAPQRDLDDRRLSGLYVLLPSRVRSRLESEAVISLAGPLAGKIYVPGLTRWPRAIPIAPTPIIHTLTAPERLWIASGDDDAPPPPHDEEHALAAVRALSLRDADLLLELMRRATEQLVFSPEFARSVEALAPALVEHIDLGARDVRRLLREATRKVVAA